VLPQIVIVIAAEDGTSSIVVEKTKNWIPTLLKYRNSYPLYDFSSAH